jgi:hypothetical protein
MSVVTDTLDLVPAMYFKAFFFSSMYASIMSFLKLEYASQVYWTLHQKENTSQLDNAA